MQTTSIQNPITQRKYINGEWVTEQVSGNTLTGVQRVLQVTLNPTSMSGDLGDGIYSALLVVHKGTGGLILDKTIEAIPVVPSERIMLPPGLDFQVHNPSESNDVSFEVYYLGEISAEKSPKKAEDVSIEWLKSLDYKVVPVSNGPTIDGLLVKDLRVMLDGRGDVTELWSQPWIQSEGLMEVAHVYQSSTDVNVIKCWHLHDIHTDQFTVTRGKLQVSLVDLRIDSPTFRHVNTVFLGTSRPRLIKIPPMVMHGWKALSAPEVIVVNLQSHVYTPDDEWKFPWNCVLEHIWQPQNG